MVGFAAARRDELSIEANAEALNERVVSTAGVALFASDGDEADASFLAAFAPLPDA